MKRSQAFVKSMGEFAPNILIVANTGSMMGPGQQTFEIISGDVFSLRSQVADWLNFQHARAMNQRSQPPNASGT